MSTNLMTVLIAVKWLQKEQSLVLDSCCTSVASLYKEGPVYDQPVNRVQPLPCPLNLTPRNFPVFSWMGQVSGVISWIKYSVGGGYHVHLECHVWDSIWCLPMRKKIKRRSLPRSDRWVGLKLSDGYLESVKPAGHKICPQRQRLSVGLDCHDVERWTENIVQK